MALRKGGEGGFGITGAALSGGEPRYSGTADGFVVTVEDSSHCRARLRVPFWDFIHFGWFFLKLFSSATRWGGGPQPCARWARRARGPRVIGGCQPSREPKSLRRGGIE